MPSGEHPFDGDMILIKNKNKNNKNNKYFSFLLLIVWVSLFVFISSFRPSYGYKVGKPVPLLVFLYM